MSDRKICCVLDRPWSPLALPVPAGGGGAGAEAEGLCSFPFSLADEGAASTAGLKARRAAAVATMNCMVLGVGRRSERREYACVGLAVPLTT